MLCAAIQRVLRFCVVSVLCIFTWNSVVIVDACSAAVVNCNDTLPSVSFRTLDFEADTIFEQGSMKFVPAGGSIATDTGSFPVKYGFISHSFDIDGVRLSVDGMNEQGLTYGIFTQGTAGFWNPEQSDAPGSVPFVDFIQIVLANFSSIEEIKAVYGQDGSRVVTSTVKNPVLAESLTGGLNGRVSQVPGETDTYLFTFQVFLTDKTGAGLVFQGRGEDEPGYDLLYSQVMANEPSLQQQLDVAVPAAQEYLSDREGVTMPYNTESPDRFLRMFTALQECGRYMWPSSGIWSPADPANAPPDVPFDTFKALKRAENMMYSVIVPMSILNGDIEPDSVEGFYDTEMMYLRSSEDGLYYYKAPRDSVWNSVDLQEMSKQGEVVEFYPVQPKSAFAIKAIQKNGGSAPSPSSLSPSSSSSSLFKTVGGMLSFLFLWCLYLI
mmetsp:Transcript_1698/g.3501  ORF Transcript_1698/g.3501 Transcript_1698/m.3501 type:complete len:438 (-) Transcript_1698:219-1532(-)